MSLQLEAASYIYIPYTLKKMIKGRQWWQRQLYTNREVHSGTSLLVDLNLQSVSGLYKNFTRMSPSKLEFLIHLIGEEILKKNTALKKTIYVQESWALTIYFLARFQSK
jgi:hypothetical protein